MYALQGCKSGISHLPVVPVTLVGSSQNTSVLSSTKINSPISLVQTSFTSSANKVYQNGRASEHEDVNSKNGPQASSHAQPISNYVLHSAPWLTHEAAGKLYETVDVGFIQIMMNDLKLGISLLCWFLCVLIFTASRSLVPLLFSLMTKHQ